MGARWNWEAICAVGHVYGNFSGGADSCYTCEADPIATFEGDDAMTQLADFLGANWKTLKPSELVLRTREQQVKQALEARRFSATAALVFGGEYNDRTVAELRAEVERRIAAGPLT